MKKDPKGDARDKKGKMVKCKECGKAYAGKSCPHCAKAGAGKGKAVTY